MDCKSKIYKDKEIKNKSGIYLIRNNINNKFYIGSSKNLQYRKYQHFYLLNNKIHFNNHLQNSFNKYGKHNFSFEVVEFCNEQDRLSIEQKYLNIYHGFKNVYNICNIAGVGPSNCIKIICLETNKIYNSVKEASIELNLDSSTLSKVCLHKKSSIKKLHFMYYEEYIKSNKNYIIDILMKDRNGVKILCKETGEKFYSISLASKKYNISRTAIGNCLNKRSKTSGGFHWEYI